MKLSEVCRLCLIKSSNNSDELFLPVNESIENKFNEIVNNKVLFAKAQNVEYQMEFPNKACISCVTELDQHFNYRNGLIERQKQLNTLLGVTEEIETEVEQQSVKDLVKNESREEETIVQELNDEVDYNDNFEEHNLQTLKDEKTTSEYNIEFEETNQLNEDEEQRDFEYIDYEEAEAESATEEDFTENGVDEEEMEDGDVEANEDQFEEDELICSVDIKSLEDTDSDYVVYEEDIAMEDESKLVHLVKRKYSKKSKDSPNQFRCWVKDCGASFSFRATMRKHMQQSHAISCDKSTCFICGDKYDNYPDFLAHMKSHTRKAECDVCKLTFVDEDKLKKHTMRVHIKNDDDERNFQCHVSFHCVECFRLKLKFIFF